MIPIHTFVNAFPYFNPRIHILTFLNWSHAWMLETVQNLFSGGHGIQENVRAKVCIKLFETSKLTISNMPNSHHFNQ